MNPNRYPYIIVRRRVHEAGARTEQLERLNFDDEDEAINTLDDMVAGRADDEAILFTANARILRRGTEQ